MQPHFTPSTAGTFPSNSGRFACRWCFAPDHFVSETARSLCDFVSHTSLADRSNTAILFKIRTPGASTYVNFIYLKKNKYVLVFGFVLQHFWLILKTYFESPLNYFPSSPHSPERWYFWKICKYNSEENNVIPLKQLCSWCSVNRKFFKFCLIKITFNKIIV